jgi:two-component system, cell cycle sensor histidine kinase and response regulator CckA
VVETLSTLNYKVREAANAEAALGILGDSGPVDLLLTDVVMPGMSGRELAELLVPRRPGMRLLYVSGYTEDATIRHGVSSEETAFLGKPFTPSVLLKKVQEVLDAVPVEMAGNAV